MKTNLEVEVEVYLRQLGKVLIFRDKQTNRTFLLYIDPLAGTNPNLFRNLFKAGHCCRYLPGTLLYNTLVLMMRPSLTFPGVAELDLGNCSFGTIPGKLIGLSDYIYQCKSISMIM